MGLDRQAQERIETLRMQLYDGLRGSLDPRQVDGLLPISQELDRLSVALLRARWQRTACTDALPAPNGQDSGQKL
ncbi:hypothetical protein J2Z79_001032 [Symbiobacterium terraclitae]|uniref:Spo0E like sporulation regulatory protein n=1 Tax=Symbiobacterium terraclitae TaxID=557451 RepID=A0ABS4JQ41_9FIRM|nr:hypothetical protein [Symbiobacterium terraclitae]MBP2017647.1 hypothetical protein [Symbiobacterium terraclitae]